MILENHKLYNTTLLIFYTELNKQNSVDRKLNVSQQRLERGAVYELGKLLPHFMKYTLCPELQIQLDKGLHGSINLNKIASLKCY